MRYSDFVHLHVHSDFSLLDGAGKISSYVERALALNMPALALGLMGLGIAQGMRGRYLSSACSLFMNAIMAQAGWPADRPGSGHRAGLRASRFLRHRSTMRRKAKTPIAH